MIGLDLIAGREIRRNAPDLPLKSNIIARSVVEATTTPDEKQSTLSRRRRLRRPDISRSRDY
jgi:hypothetical protein